MDKGTTALILDAFLAGMRGAGAEFERFYTRKLHINPCRGDFRCSTHTPRECIHKDDMQALVHPKLCEADI
jgi:multimeric flavodoxin WrbA